MKQFKKYLSSVAVVATLLSPMVLVGNAMALTDEERFERKNAKTKVLSPKVGKKVQKTFDLFSAEDVDGALEMILEVTTSKSYDSAYLNKFIGNIYATQEGKLDQAISYMEKAVAPDVLNYKEQGDSINMLAQLYMMKKRYRDSIARYQDWMDFTGEETDKVWMRIANSYYELKQLDKVIAPADKAIKLAEKLSETPYVLKLASYYERKMFKETVSVGEELVRIFPEEKRYWTQLGMFYVLIEEYYKGLSTMEMAYKQGYLEKASEFRTLAQMYSQVDIPLKAATIQEKYIKLGVMKRNEQTLKRLANYFLAAKELVKSAKYFGEAAEMNGKADLYRRQGEMLFQAEKYGQAVVALKKALDKDVKKKGAVNLTLMQAYFYQGKYKQAYASMEQANKYPKSRSQAKSWRQYIKDKASRNGVKI